MKRSIVVGAAALLLGIATAPMPLAWSADNPPQAGQPAPIIPPTDQSAAAEPGAAGMAGHEGMGPMEHGGWQRRMMMMRGMMRMSPPQRCVERLARHAGVIAYTLAKLNLTPAQRPLWDKVQGVLQAAGDRERQLCATLKSREAQNQVTILDRLDRREQFLSARLQALQQIRPAMRQFYQSLTPDQQAIINHPFRPN